jgi:cell division septation protein DedD
MKSDGDPQLGLRNRALKRAGIAMAVAGLLVVAALAVEQRVSVDGEAGIATGRFARSLPEPAPMAVPPMVPARLAAQADEGPIGSMPDGAREAAQAAPVPNAAPEPEPRLDAAPAPDAPATAPRAIPPAPADGFRIQLGVFGDPENAHALQRELAGKGLPATIQSRVVLGPFPDRASAEKARAALRNAGHEAGMLLPPPRSKP